MNQAEQPEALQFAAYLESFFISEEVHATKARKIAASLRFQNAKIMDMDAKLVKEAERTAQEKLRADKMSQQHDTQAALNSEARNELAQERARILELEACHSEELRAYELTVSNLRAKVEELEQGKCLLQIADPAKYPALPQFEWGKLFTADQMRAYVDADRAQRAAVQQAVAHPDDAAVDALAALMKAKLAKQRAKGYGGWNDKTQCPQQRLSDMLRAHVEKGDPIDVANFCAFLQARGEGIAAAPQAD